MGTYSEIQDRVEALVIDLPAAVQSAVPNLVNSAMRQVQQDYNFEIMKETLEVTTTVDTRALSSGLPSDFKEWRGDPWYEEDTGQIRIIFHRPTIQDVYRVYDEQDEGPPKYIVRGDPSDVAGTQALNIYPLPDGNSDYDDGEYRIFVPYWKFLPALSGDGDTNWLTVHGEDYLVYKAAADAFGMDWDEERMALWLQRAKDQRDRLIREDKLLKLSNTTTLVPRSGGYFDPGYKRTY